MTLPAYPSQARIHPERSPSAPSHSSHPRFLTLVLFLAFIALARTADDTPTNPAEDLIFRAPFMLKLHVDKEHFYEENFGKVPYVAKGDVYLFKGEEFGLNLDIQDGAILSVKYQPDVKKADVTLKFTQNVKDDGTAMMLLTIHNNTKSTLQMDAVMTVPGKKEILKTSILPIQAGLADYESWPHPIVQLVPQNIRTQK